MGNLCIYMYMCVCVCAYGYFNEDLQVLSVTPYQVYFSGFLHAHVEKLTVLLHLVGAVRLKQLNSAVTHVLVGQQDQEETVKLARIGNKCVHVCVRVRVCVRVCVFERERILGRKERCDRMGRRVAGMRREKGR